MKSKKSSSSLKKYQKAGTVTGASGATSDGRTYTGVVRRPTAGGPRYYTGESPDYNIAMSIAQSKARREGADSTKRSTLSKMQLEELGEKKKGGSVTKMKKGGTVKKSSKPKKK
jgi:hypothetical protein